MNAKQTPEQKRAVEKAVSWISTERTEKKRLRVILYHSGKMPKKGNELYDILAVRNERALRENKRSEHWVIKVETDKEPSINISREMEEIINSEDPALLNFRKVGLALVSQKSPWPFLFEYNRQENAGYKAAKTRKRKSARLQKSM